MKRKKNPGIIIISLLVIALFIGCTQTQKAQKANISVEMVETMTCELLGLKAYTMEIQIDSPAKSLDIITQDNRKRIPISGKQSIQITDYFTDSQNDTMKIQLINDKEPSSLNKTFNYPLLLKDQSILNSTKGSILKNQEK